MTWANAARNGPYIFILLSDSGGRSGLAFAVRSWEMRSTGRRQKVRTYVEEASGRP